jgi:hypothetical protein
MKPFPPPPPPPPLLLLLLLPQTPPTPRTPLSANRSRWNSERLASNGWCPCRPITVPMAVSAATSALERPR